MSTNWGLLLRLILTINPMKLECKENFEFTSNIFLSFFFLQSQILIWQLDLPQTKPPDAMDDKILKSLILLAEPMYLNIQTWNLYQQAITSRKMKEPREDQAKYEKWTGGSHQKTSSHDTQQWPAEIPYIQLYFSWSKFFLFSMITFINNITKIHNMQNLYPVLFSIRNFLNSRNWLIHI